MFLEISEVLQNDAVATFRVFHDRHGRVNAPIRSVSAMRVEATATTTANDKVWIFMVLVNLLGATLRERRSKRHYENYHSVG